MAQIRQISPDVDLYELGLREVGESLEPAAAHLAHAQRLIHDGSVALDEVRRVLRELDEEGHKIARLGDDWIEYIRVEMPTREQEGSRLLEYASGAHDDEERRRLDGEPLTRLEAGSLAQAYVMDVLELRQAIFLDVHAQLLIELQERLDEMSRTINETGTYVLSSVIRRMRRARVWAFQLRSALLALISIALVAVGITFEDLVTGWAGESFLIVFAAGAVMWAVADLITWCGDRWIHRHHLAALTEALTRTCSALVLLREQEHRYNVQRGACGWEAVTLLPRPTVPTSYA